MKLSYLSGTARDARVEPRRRAGAGGLSACGDPRKGTGWGRL